MPSTTVPPIDVSLHNIAVAAKQIAADSYEQRWIQQAIYNALTERSELLYYFPHPPEPQIGQAQTSTTLNEKIKWPELTASGGISDDSELVVTMKHILGLFASHKQVVWRLPRPTEQAPNISAVGTNPFEVRDTTDTYTTIADMLDGALYKRDISNPLMRIPYIKDMAFDLALLPVRLRDGFNALLSCFSMSGVGFTTVFAYTMNDNGEWNRDAGSYLRKISNKEFTTNVNVSPRITAEVDMNESGLTINNQITVPVPTVQVINNVDACCSDVTKPVDPPVDPPSGGYTPIDPTRPVSPTNPTNQPYKPIIPIVPNQLQRNGACGFVWFVGNHLADYLEWIFSVRTYITPLVVTSGLTVAIGWLRDNWFGKAIADTVWLDKMVDYQLRILVNCIAVIDLVPNVMVGIMRIKIDELACDLPDSTNPSNASFWITFIGMDGFPVTASAVARQALEMIVQQYIENAMYDALNRQFDYNSYEQYCPCEIDLIDPCIGLTAMAFGQPHSVVSYPFYVSGESNVPLPPVYSETFAINQGYIQITQAFPYIANPLINVTTEDIIGVFDVFVDVFDVDGLGGNPIPITRPDLGLDGIYGGMTIPESNNLYRSNVRFSNWTYRIEGGVLYVCVTLKTYTTGQPELTELTNTLTGGNLAVVLKPRIYINDPVTLPPIDPSFGIGSPFTNNHDSDTWDGQPVFNADCRDFYDFELQKVIPSPEWSSWNGRNQVFNISQVFEIDSTDNLLHDRQYITNILEVYNATFYFEWQHRAGTVEYSVSNPHPITVNAIGWDKLSSNTIRVNATMYVSPYQLTDIVRWGNEGGKIRVKLCPHIRYTYTYNEPTVPRTRRGLLLTTPSIDTPQFTADFSSIIVPVGATLTLENYGYPITLEAGQRVITSAYDPYDGISLVLKANYTLPDGGIGYMAWTASKEPYSPPCGGGLPPILEQLRYERHRNQMYITVRWFSYDDYFTCKLGDTVIAGLVPNQATGTWEQQDHTFTVNVPLPDYGLHEVIVTMYDYSGMDCFTTAPMNVSILEPVFVAQAITEGESDLIGSTNHATDFTRFEWVKGLTPTMPSPINLASILLPSGETGEVPIAIDTWVIPLNGEVIDMADTNIDGALIPALRLEAASVMRFNNINVDTWHFPAIYYDVFGALDGQFAWRLEYVAQGIPVYLGGFSSLFSYIAEWSKKNPYDGVWLNLVQGMGIPFPSLPNTTWYNDGLSLYKLQHAMNFDMSIGYKRLPYSGYVSYMLKRPSVNELPIGAVWSVVSGHGSTLIESGQLTNCEYRLVNSEYVVIGGIATPVNQSPDNYITLKEVLWG